MDITALYDREVAYYAGRSIVVYLPDANTELPATAQVSKTDLGVRTTIEAPFSPTSNQVVSEIRVLNKPFGHPASYSATFTSPDSATFTPTPQFTIGQRLTIGDSTYTTVTIDGSSVTLERAVSELLVFVAPAASNDVVYQWQILEGSEWVNIPGADERTYEPVAGDVGKDLRVIITYTDGRGPVEEAASTTPTFVPNQVFTVTPVYPVIAELTLDIQRNYAPNSINTLVVEIDSL